MGFHLPKERVPISPAFHYAVGGIKTNIDGSIPGIKGLYAAGEAASTGVHGANRLASNSLLEGLVFAQKAARSVIDNSVNSCNTRFEIGTEALEMPGDKEKKDFLRRIMWENVSIVRTPKGLQRAREAIEEMLNQKIGRLLRLRLLSARCIVESAQKRSKSIGVHYMTQGVSE